MRIRRATELDESAMRVMWEEFSAETTYTPYPGSPFSPSLLNDQIALIAEADGVATGSVYAATPSDEYGFVFGLYVRPEARRQGLAAQLMRAAAEALAASGRRYVVLSVDTPNVAARSLYDDLGFVDAARTLRVEIGALLRGH